MSTCNESDPRVEQQTRNFEMFAALAAKFTGDQVKFRQVGGGQKLPYITARTVMNRLDDVVGPANWWDDYQVIGESAVICRLTICMYGETITKCDVGGMSATKDESDAEKSGFSDAFKRAAVKFGVGRHLYGDGVPNFVREVLAANNKPQPQREERPPDKAPQRGNGRRNDEREYSYDDIP